MRKKTVESDKISTKILKKALILILILILVYNLTYNLLALFNINSFFGIRFFALSSSTMAPTINKNDLIVVAKAKELKQGDIILCYKDETYRVRRIINGTIKIKKRLIKDPPV